MATTRSLATLAESSGCESEMVRAASQLSSAPSNVDGQQTPASPGRRMSVVSDRSQPASVLSMLSNMTWSNEKSTSLTFLQYVTLL